MQLRLIWAIHTCDVIYGIKTYLNINHLEPLIVSTLLS